MLCIDEFCRAGLIPITICSAHNFEFVKSLGAVAAFDYKDQNCVAQAKEFLGPNKDIKYFFDTISTTASADICGKLIATGGSWAYLLLGTKFPRDDVQTMYPLAYLSVGERIKKGNDIDFAASQADFEFVSEWMRLVEDLLENNLIKPHPGQVERGLEKVLNGLELMRNGQVSGKKLVYTL